MGASAEVVLLATASTAEYLKLPDRVPDVSQLVAAVKPAQLSDWTLKLTFLFD